MLQRPFWSNLVQQREVSLNKYAAEPDPLVAIDVTCFSSSTGWLKFATNYSSSVNRLNILPITMDLSSG